MSDGISDGLSGFPEARYSSGLNGLSRQCGETAGSKGFHQAFEDADWLISIVERINESSGEAVYFDPEEADRLEDIAARIRLLEVGMKSMLVVSEIAEGIDSMRDTGYQGHLDGEGNWGEELADAVIRLGDLSHMTHVRLGDQVDDKMAVNKDRPYKHGRQA